MLDRRIVLLALPALGSIAAEPLYNLVDTAIVGHLGAVDLDALALAGTVLTFLGWVANFLTTATTSRVARLVGSGDVEGARRAVGAAYLMAVVLGLLGGVAVWAAAPTVVHVLGGHAAGSDASITYMRLAAIGLPLLFVSFAGSGHLTGLALVGTPLRIVVVANLVNVVLEVVLVYPAGLGLRGSALGTVAAQLVAAVAFVVSSWRQVSVGAPRWAPAEEIRRLLRDGVRLSVRTIAVGGVPLVVTVAAARLGPDQLAGNQIALRLWLMLSMTVDALAVPAQVYVSAALGRGDPVGAAAIGGRILRLGLAAGVGLGVVTAAAAWALPPLFTGDPAIARAARVALLVGAALQPLAAAAFVFDGLVLGLSDYLSLRNAMVAALAVFAPFAVLTALFHGLGLAFLWAGLGGWLATRTTLLRRRWIRAGGTSTAPRAVERPAQEAVAPG